MLNARHLSKSYGTRQAVDDLSFEAGPGQVLGFLGPNGAGKSTTMRMLTGYLFPTAGQVNINGFDMETSPIQAKQCIGYLPENAPSYPDSTVEEFLTFIASVKSRHPAREVKRVLQLCSLEQVRRQAIDTLSKGYRHRVCFAQALINDPPILILDEPTDGLDPNQKHDMRCLIRDLGKTKTIIVSTHILEEVESLCTSTIIINQGKMVFNGTLNELRNHAGTPDTIRLRLAQPMSLDEFKAKTQQLNGIQDVTLQKLHNHSYFCITPQTTALQEQLLLELEQLCSQNHWECLERYAQPKPLEKLFRQLTTTDV